MKTLEELKDAVIDVLKLDIRGTSQNRGSVSKKRHKLSLDGIEFLFHFDQDRTIRVVSAEQKPSQWSTAPLL